MTYRLHKCLPGQRDASANWHDDVSGFLKGVCEMQQCKENPVLFRAENPELNGDILSIGLLHVDDFMLRGLRSDLKRILERITLMYEVNVERLDAGNEVWFSSVHIA